MNGIKTVTTVHVYGGWNENDESFHIYGKNDKQQYLTARTIIRIMFAWHGPSFFGTTLETVQVDRMELVRLDALTALDYFADPDHNSLIHLEWKGDLPAVMRSAPLIAKALEADYMEPDFASWLEGRPGWKIADRFWTEHRTDSVNEPFFRPWLSRLVEERLEQMPDEGEFKAAWRRAGDSFPMRHREQLPEGLYGTEEEWLAAIGWREPSTPYTVCLQLVEPDTPEAESDESDSLLALDGLNEEWRLRIVLQDRRDGSLRYRYGGDRLPDDWHESEARAHVAAAARQWRLLVPWLSSMEDTEAVRSITEEEAWLFLTEDALRLVRCGHTVLLPAWWESLQKARPRLTARMSSSVGSAAQPLLGMDQIVAFDWKLAIGSAEITDDQFRTLVESRKRLARIGGQWVQLDPDTLLHMQQAMKRRGKGLTLGESLKLYLQDAANADGDADAEGAQAADEGQEEAAIDPGIRLEVELSAHLAQMLRTLQNVKQIPPIAPPSQLQGALRNYQLTGSSWLAYLRRFRLGGCLADDMGLGKTIQYITYLLNLKEERDPADCGIPAPSLLICPTSVLGNWQKELERFAPSLDIRLHYGPSRSKGESFAEAVSGCDLVLTSYNLANLDEAELGGIEWESICLDEAQNIKNVYTKQSQAIRKLNARHRIAMTGTPIENRLTELWSIFDFMNPGYLDTLHAFQHRFVGPIERTRDTMLIGQVQKLVQPFLLRRMKTDPVVELDLPDKLESKVYLSLTVEQTSMYEYTVQHLFEQLNKLSAMERRGLILATLTKLKQICDHPALSAKEPGDQVVWKDRSGKIERLVEMVQELRQEGDRCLIFTQFVEMGYLLQKVLQQELEQPVQFLHGGTSKTQRDAMIARYQDATLPESEQCGIFILSLKAGGVGLNLTAANHVFHVDRWWNPAVENQATDRAYRIGQTKLVQVHKFISIGTLEEKIDLMLERKQDLSKQIIGASAGENWITELSDDDLKELFALR